MLSRFPVIILAAAAVAAAVAGCSAHAAPPGTPAPATAAAAARAAAPSCSQQYHAWRYSAAGKKLKADLSAVQAAGSTEDLPAILAALKTAGSDAAAMANDPAPACADPHGYWKQIFARLAAAGDNAGSASGLSGLILAEAPLKAIPALQSKLAAELKRTTGTSALPR